MPPNKLSRSRGARWNFRERADGTLGGAIDLKASILYALMNTEDSAVCGSDTLAVCDDTLSRKNTCVVSVTAGPNINGEH